MPAVIGLSIQYSLWSKDRYFCTLEFEWMSMWFILQNKDRSFIHIGNSHPCVYSIPMLTSVNC